MQDRYAGDIGDYVKISLLRALVPQRRLGVAWFRYRDEDHNGDGRHTAYLSAPDKWRHLDAPLFDLLAGEVALARSIYGLQKAFGPATCFMDEPVPVDLSSGERSYARHQWFGNCLSRLKDANLVFADPDNGLVDDQEWRRRSPTFSKQISLSEARALSEGRCAVIYHHNSRFKGGHDAEVDHWLSEIGMPALAVRATAYSCRTFFIVNPDAEIVERTKKFCRRWANHKVRLHQSSINRGF